MKKRIITIMAAAIVLAAGVSCEKMGGIGGSVNSTEPLDMTSMEWLASQDETAVVAQLFAAAGLTDIVNSDVTVIAPNKWAVNRFIRRHNSMTRKPADAPRYTLDSLLQNEDLSQMQMYIYPGVWTYDDLEDSGVYLTSLDGNQELYLSYDEVNIEPSAAYDGGNVAGSGYQYSNFLLSKPKVVHALFKRGENWEHVYLDRFNMGFDKPECDQAYKMYISNVRTRNGVIHVLYAGDSAYAEQYYYHSLFFYGTREDDK